MIKSLKMKNRKKGFTLIELIIVISIIGILAAIAVPKFSEIRNNANAKSDIADAKTLANAAATLIAEGKIILPGANANNKDLTISTANADPDTDPDADADKIEKYVQSVPTPKNGGTNFHVIIDKDGEVTVTNGSATLFPQ